MPKAKVYAVARGRTVGVFDTWTGPGGAQEATSGFADAKFKAFKTQSDAIAYLREHGVSACAAAPAASPRVASPSSASRFFTHAAASSATPCLTSGSSVGHYSALPLADPSATGLDELDGLDDSFLEDVDIDAIVRRHSAPGNQAAAKRPRSPATDGNGKRQRCSLPSVQRAAPKGVVASVPKRDYPFHQPDAEVQRRISAIPDSIRRELMPHQLAGLQFLLKCDGRALLADGMGLGKTLQAIAMVAAYREEWPLLILAPSGLRANWLDEIRRWLPQQWLDVPAPAASWANRKKMTKKAAAVVPAAVHAVASADELPSSVDSLAPITIISYDLLPKLSASELPMPRVVVCDESHLLKNKDAARTKAVLPLLLKARRVLLMSGTPSLSRPSELFPQLHAIRPELFPRWETYVERYCGGHKDRWGNASGSSNEAELQQLLGEALMIRRDKEGCLQLPAKRRSVVNLDPAALPRATMAEMQAALGNLAQVEARIQSAGASASEQLYNAQQAALSKCRQLSVDAKETGVMDFVRAKLQAEPERKLLLFAHHKSMLHMAERVLRDELAIDFVLITGEVTPLKRQERVREFQRDKQRRVAIVSIKAAGTGLNLTAASICVFAELAWTPGELTQAEDRAHRIGQRSPVDIFYILAPGTLDERIWGSIKRKLEVVDSTVGLGRSSASLSSAAASSGINTVSSGGGIGTQDQTDSRQSDVACDCIGTVTSSAPIVQPETICITSTGPTVHRPPAATAAANAPEPVGASVGSTTTSSRSARWLWASGSGSVLYDSDICCKLEAAWQALRHEEPGAHIAARQVHIGGGRHVDLVRSRQVVTAEPHRTRRVFRRDNGVG